MTDPQYIDRLLSFDALSQAEDFTGLSYKEDEITSSLGMLMHIENGQRKRAALQASNDTYYSIEFLDAVDIALDLGFEPIYAQTKPDNREYGRGQPVHYNAYWREGILLVMESFDSNLNTASVYFNYRNSDGDTAWPNWDLGLSGGWSRMTPGFDGILEDDPWTLTVSMNVVEGFRRKLDRLAAEPGHILDEWYIRPSMYLVSYVEERGKPGDGSARKITEEKIEHFSEPVRSMILETPNR